jgi:uncharacterized membrane protein (UPF0182 family)
VSSVAIPMSDAFIYVEPIYLEAKQEVKQPAAAPQSQSGLKRQKQQAARPARKGSTTTASLPELKRVIVAIGNRVVMERRLDMALNRALVGETAQRKAASPLMSVTEEVSDLGIQALQYYNKAKAYLQEGDWAGYGRELEKLEGVLKQLSKPNASKE